MADETTQTGEETSWWDLDLFANSELPSTAFDEPLEWPDTLDWGDFPATDGDLEFPGTGHPDDSDAIFPPAPVSDPAPQAASGAEPANGADAQWQPTGDEGDATMPHVTVLSGLGGGGSPAHLARAAEQTSHERLPDALWAGGTGNGVPPLVTTTIAAPTFYAERDGGAGGAGGWRRRFDIRHGNAAIIALISFVSLILLGMFMSVRARNQTPDTSQTRTTSDQIQVQGTLNTVPLTTTVTTIPQAINIADLVPPAEDATTATEATGGTGSGGSGATSPATTAAPARSTPAGGTTGTTQAPAQPTATTAAPQTTVPETTTPTSPPVDQTTTPTTPRRTTPTFPSITSTVPSGNTPTFPSIPGFTIPPGFGN